MLKKEFVFELSKYYIDYKMLVNVEIDILEI